MAERTRISDAFSDGLHYVSLGSGTHQVVGIHGWSGDHSTFDPLIEYLPTAATLHSLDLPGVGLSSVPRAWELAVIVEQVAQMVSGFGRGPVTLAGSCSGALICLFVARYFQDKGRGDIIDRVVMIDAFAYLPWYFRVFVSRRVGRMGWRAYRATFATPVGRWLTNLSLRGHRKDQTNLTESFRVVDHEVTYRYLAMLGNIGDVTQFRGLNVHVDVVYGERTFAAVKASAGMWKRTLENCRCYELEGAGHLPIDEATSSLAAIVFGR